MIAFQVGLSVLTLCLTLLNLVLILGITRRGRRNATAQASSGGLQLSHPPGTPIGEFTATSTEGATVRRDDLELGTVVAFLSPGCEPCQEAMPDYVAYATANPGTVVSVLSGEYGAEVRATLESLGPVVVEVPNGPVARAFGVIGVPVFVTVGAGNVLESSPKIGPAVRVPAPH
ncbi:TlpA family protein disulfide reductase [Herbidospora cretacea]|uniref:TlpA family protein disulfide reductase n=1 Tax=Herbidospora cretacea TaxID=28444 RepID=UPI000689E9CE|nr:redoxin domain-containing protein [Herbidospora cretacea]